jgi:hypothetical protein
MKMQAWNQLSDPMTWLWIILWTLLLWLFFFLATWIVESKTRAKSKLAILFLVALISVILIPILQSLTTELALGTTALNGLAAYIAYFLVICLLVGLAVEYWKSAVLIGFLGIMFLLIVYNLLLLAGVSQAATWPLFI